MLVVTIDSVPGYEIVAVIGDVLGATARAQNSFIEGARSLSGVASRQQSEMLGRCRREAVGRMATTAHQRGANAVVGMRFDHRNIGGSWVEVCAYGTAVVVTPARR